MSDRHPVLIWLARLRETVGTAGRPWRILVARRAVRQAAAGVGPARTALQRFDECSAGEFTALAEGLGELDRQLTIVREMSARLASTLQDHDEDRALSSAFSLYKKSVDLAHASIGIAVSQEEEMERMEGGLLENRDAFSRTNLLFRMLVMNIRVEAARINPEDRAVFFSVASEMEQMERRMSSTLETAFSQLETIVDDAANGRVQLQQLRETLQTGAQQSIRLLRLEFDGITERLKPCLTASQETSHLLDAARDHTGRLITSLQFQDIVRQQLEHVGEGLADIAAHLAPTGAGARVDLGYLAQAVRVQQFNLEASHQAIGNAADQIDQAGAALLATGSSLVTVFGQMEQEAARVFHGSQLGELFQAETAKLVTVAGQSEATNERITRLLERIGESITVFSSELMEQELDVHLVALNAQVAAARLPEARALNKLAEETAGLARESAELSRTMSSQLSATLTRLNGMRQEADEVRRTIGQEKAELAQGSVTVRDKLTRFNQRVSQTSAEVATNFNTAYQHLQALLGSLKFPAAIATSFAPAGDLCTRLASATDGFFVAGGHAALDDHHGRYTMRQERAAHAAALGHELSTEDESSVELFSDVPTPAASKADALAAEPAPAPPTSAAPVTTGGDIELF